MRLAVPGKTRRPSAAPSIARTVRGPWTSCTRTTRPGASSTSIPASRATSAIGLPRTAKSRRSESSMTSPRRTLTSACASEILGSSIQKAAVGSRPIRPPGSTSTVFPSGARKRTNARMAHCRAIPGRSARPSEGRPTRVGSACDAPL